MAYESSGQRGSSSGLFTTGTALMLSVSNGRDAVWSGAYSSGANKTRTSTFTIDSAATVTVDVR